MTFFRLLAFLCAIGFPNAIVPQPAETVITVAADGTGQFRSVQAALDSLPPNRTERTILQIRPGTYREAVHIAPNRSPITFRGEKAETTVLTFDRHAAQVAPDGKPFSTSRTASVTLESDNFRAENITFENTAGRTAGQAVAVRVSGDRCVFQNCRFLGWQDTLYANGAGKRQFFKNCRIEGHVDFIFGSAAAVFDHCEIYSRAQGVAVTAQSRTSETERSGYIFRECRLTAAPETPAASVDLGRPWRPFARVVFVKCWLGPHIRPVGWNNWRDPAREKTAYFAEYDSSGPGAAPTQRVPWSRQLQTSDLAPFESSAFFGDWNPEAG